MLIAPLRAAGAGFAATVNGIVALPWPLRLPDTVTHETLAATDHAQSRAVVTDTVPLPPEASNDPGALVAATSHLSVVGEVTEVLVDVHAAAAAAHASAAASRVDLEITARANARGSP
jgi:hypothetical protein